MVQDSPPREGPSETESDSVSSVDTEPSSIAHLQAEIAKWRARVPKLAAALNERTERVNQLESQIAQTANAQTAGSEGGAGARARDERIRELDTKLEQARAELRSAQSALHERSLRVAELEGELTEWQNKWQSVTQELDNGDSAAARSATELKDANTEIASLKKRADDLIATAEMAHNEVDVLSADLRGLRCDLGRTSDEKKALEESLEQAKLRADTAEQEASGVLADAQARFDELTREHETQAQKFLELEQTLLAREAELGEACERLSETEQRLSEAEASLAKAGNAGEQKLSALQERFDQQELELTEALSLAESARSDSQSLTAELDTLRAQADVMTASQQALQSEIAEQNQQLQASERELAAAKEGVSVARAEAESARVQLDDARQSKRKAEAAAEAAVQSGAGASQELEEARGLFQQAVSDLAKLRGELGQTQTSLDKLIVERDAALATSAALESDMRSLQVGATDSAAQAQEISEQHEVLRAELEQGRRDLDAAREEFDNAEAARVTAERECEALSARLAEQQAASSEQEKRLESAEISALQNALREKDSEIEEQSVRYQGEIERSQRGIASIESERDQLTAQLSEQAKSHEAIQSELLAELSRVSQPHSNDGADVLAGSAATDDRIAALESSLGEQRKQFDQYKLKSIAQIDIQDKTLIVLNQQLVDSQAENDRLRAALNEAKRSVEEPNLTEIKGIGAKLAKQLNEVGVTSVIQLAELTDNVIDDDHVLAPFRSRAMRDNWFEQARALADSGPVIN